MSDGQFDRIDRRFNEMDQRLDRLEARLDGRISDLDRHMRVLHEDVIARVAALPEYSGPTKAEFAELKDLIERRLEPLEAAVRHHSADIERLKRART
jgi:hypothetical protein